MADCLCGCGANANGAFVPGHDQRLRTSLEQRVGGLIALSSIVTAIENYMTGEADAEDLAGSVREAFYQQRSPVP